jgi:secondary thiamine-phosphate synthase enzyme
VKTIEISTSRREELIDVTTAVQEVVAAGGVHDGICLIYSPHTTCGMTINEGWDPDVLRDAVRHFRELVPERAGWAHAEGNSDAHIKTILVGASVQMPISQSRLQLGRWQKVFLCEFDGPRTRQLWLTILGKD